MFDFDFMDRKCRINDDDCPDTRKYMHLLALLAYVNPRILRLHSAAGELEHKGIIHLRRRRGQKNIRANVTIAWGNLDRKSGRRDRYGWEKIKTKERTIIHVNETKMKHQRKYFLRQPFAASGPHLLVMSIVPNKDLKHELDENMKRRKGYSDGGAREK
ncbi:hypothetical protein BDN70DRAFT_895295 [Pholiota conissans]|uniref:Uncharacterized protein n=1 Tax=Pholiota conissans TaxID=109636 RepID=A0A9P6CTZ7_9AGAR|nr:hypothetical protein BDN70DRAFT_895295 [Pholiota conissans]